MTGQAQANGHPRAAFALTTAGVLVALALVPTAFLAPFYRGEVATSSGAVTSSTATLVAVNGLRVLLPVSIPALLALAAWLGLQRRCRTGSRIGSIVAWTAASLLAIFTVVAFSIGMLVLPTTVLIIVGASLTPLGRRATG